MQITPRYDILLKKQASRIFNMRIMPKPKKKYTSHIQHASHVKKSNIRSMFILYIVCWTSEILMLLSNIFFYLCFFFFCLIFFTFLRWWGFVISHSLHDFLRWQMLETFCHKLIKFYFFKNKCYFIFNIFNF